MQNHLAKTGQLYHNMKLRILIPLVIAIMILIGCGLWGMYWQTQKSINENVQSRITGASRVLSNQLEDDAAHLIGYQQLIATDKQLQQAWLHKDREALLRYAAPIYEMIHASSKITHFYFIDLDQTCFLRVHRPSEFGDTINRETTQQAVHTGKTSYGIELGKFGQFTLRVVKPWFIDGKLAGYFELGEEIDHITPKLSEILGVEVFIAIDKQFLDRNQWETGLSQLDRPGDWDQLSNLIIIDQSLPQLPDGLIPLIDSGEINRTPFSLTSESTKKKYCGAILPLKDASDQQVGQLVILDDITRKAAFLGRMESLLLLAGLTTGLGLFSICYLYLTSLWKASRQLVRSANMAGKAEIATSVLHNVGNVLNSVNVSASVIQEKLSQSSVHNLMKGIDVMKQHIEDIGDFVTRDERGKHLPCYLIDVSHQLSSEEDYILEEINSLIHNIDHIKSIVASQQIHAKTDTDLIKVFSLNELLENAIKINLASMERHAIKVVRKFENIGQIYGKQQLLLQIMINLISNAKYACLESENQNHELIIRTHRVGDERIVIQVQDNGVGIPEENLTRIFAHGFTTRSEGHGFGLHSAAISAVELHGKLTAASNGPGAGATFTLEIPYQRAGVKQCTT
ncbi:cache domain-containing protein [Gimesia sp.]|uniref:cache domain-containing protein n=1 Tax=Gimesia sp. TaxID=2024833 RepID=UPI003A8D263C